MSSQAAAPTTLVPLACPSQVKPIFCAPPSHTVSPGGTRTFAITLETKVAHPSGDDYDVTVVTNPHLIASYPKTIHVNNGDSAFSLTVVAASSGTGKANIEIRERTELGVITVSLIVSGTEEQGT